MKLASFRVTKYRSIEDSGEVGVDDNVTTFVGINESGKTNLMRALKKINQDDTKFDDVTENPNWHFRRSEPEETFVKATFKLDKDEIEQVNSMTDGMLSADTVTFSKNMKMELLCHHADSFLAAEFKVNCLTPIMIIIDSIGKASPENKEQVDNVSNTFRTIEEAVRNESNNRQHDILNKVRERLNHFQQSLTPISHLALVDEINNILSIVNLQLDKLSKAREYLTSHLPRFIYFENTAIIDSRIHLPTFISKINSNMLNEDEKTAKTLLDLGNLDAAELFELGREDGLNNEQIHSNKDRLYLTLSKASKRVSDEIDRVWSQNKHTVEFVAQGNYLRVWVINKNDNVRLQLEERSRGYQWFFSFYTVFTAESEHGHKNAVILLDEPALFLHPNGQHDFLKTVLPEIATKNQILYTTHSPFMVDLTKPDSIHTVTLKDTPIRENTQKATHVSGEVWDSDHDALFPLQSALHYTMAQSMFIGTKNLIVEGITDFWLLKGMSHILESSGRIHLSNEIAIVPAGGATRTILLASMYKSQGLGVAVLLDADREGKMSYNSITKNKILRSQKVLLLNEACDQTGDMAVEDAFSENFYLGFVEKTYHNELRERGIDKITFSSKNPLIVKKLECFFKENGLGSFNKGRPARAILTELGRASIDMLPKETIKNFEMLFDKLNKTTLNSREERV